MILENELKFKASLIVCSWGLSLNDVTSTKPPSSSVHIGFHEKPYDDFSK